MHPRFRPPAFPHPKNDLPRVGPPFEGPVEFPSETTSNSPAKTDKETDQARLEFAFAEKQNQVRNGIKGLLEYREVSDQGLITVKIKGVPTRWAISATGKDSQ